jgi:nucleoside-diphosphate-sugar epimerase
MEILILGGTGFLSGALARVVREAGHGVTIFTRGQSPRPMPEGVTALVGDRHDPAAFRELGVDRAYDAVIDCICYTAEDARADVQTFAGRAGHLVMISTDFVYGGEPRRLPLTEEAPREAAGSYGRNKVAAEEVFAAAWRESRFPITVLRPPHIMGEGGLLGTGSLRGRDPELLAGLRRGEPQVLLDGGALLIQPVVHRDIAAAALAVIGASATRGQAYNMAGGEVVTSRRYYEIIAEELGTGLTVRSLPSSIYLEVYPERVPFAQHRCYDQGKLARDAGFAPQIGVREAVREMIAWLERNPPPALTEPARDAALVAALERHHAEVRALLPV